ncbi:MAG: molybdopterin-dependent oxidoreductase [Chloroflexi bacterium]|nr:molybdopterin-dependent oxidoreductase [Chloroflexota bacterium]
MRLGRRQFLKLGAGMAGVAALEQGLTRLLEAAPPTPPSVSRTTGLYRRGVPTTCQLCPARCGVVAYVDEGQVVKIEGNPLHPNNRGRICAKGQAGVNLLYDPERLLYPLKRAGARGEGQWRRVSWDEALGMVADRLKALRDQGHPEEFVFQAGTMATQRFVTRFLDAYGTPNGLNRYPHGDTNMAIAQKLTWGAQVAVPDVARTSYVLNFGANPYEASLFHLPLVQRLVEARVERGARLITFDCRLSNTAGRSDRWLPIHPGTDSLVALAMASVIMGEGLFDQEFLKQWTNYPSEKLTQHLAQYSPEVAEKASGVKAKDIRLIAREFATTKPAVAISGAGLTMHGNGTQNERCVTLLNAITGNVDVPGGYCLPRTYSFAEPEPIPPPPSRTEVTSALFPFGPHAPLHWLSALMGNGKMKVGVYMTYMHNPAYSDPQTGRVLEVVKDERLVPFFVAVDSYLSESAQLADVILPEAIYLERWDVESVPAFDLVPHVSIRQPAVVPQGETKAFPDMAVELARRIGGGMEAYFNYGGPEDYLRAAVSGIPKLKEAGGLEYLKEKGVWYDTEARPMYGAYRDAGFETPSRRWEVFSSRLQERGFPPLPTYQPLERHDSLGDGQFVLVTFKPNVLTSASAQSKWLSEIEHENRLMLHPQAAETKGIKAGDMVKVSSPQGFVSARAVVSQGLHPRVVALAWGLGHGGLGRLAQGKPFKSRDVDTLLLWWEKHGRGISPNPVIPLAPDPIAGGQAWHDTIVALDKV